MKKTVSIVTILFALSLPLGASQLQLQTIGAAGGSNLFLTYMAIGVTADAYQNKTYEGKKAISYVNSVTAQAKVVKKYLQQLIDSKELEENDVTFVKEMVATYDLLISEGDAFAKYVDSGDKSHVDSFHNYRKAAWEKISKLLGIGK